MIKSLCLLAFLLLAVTAPSVASAQIVHAAPSPAAPTAGPTLSPADAQRALEMLQDPQKREQLIATLRAIAQAVSAGEPAPPAAAAPAPAVTLKPNSLGAQLLVALSGWSARLAGEAVATLQTMNNLPALWRWLVTLETDPQASLSVGIAAGWLAVVFGGALLLEFIARWALRRPRAALTGHAPHGNGESIRLLRLLPFALARLVLDLVPVALFAAVGNLAIGVIGALGVGIDDKTRLVVIAIVNAYAGCRAAMCLARMLLSPDDRELRLWRLDDSRAAFVLSWVRRLVVVAIFGEALVEVALLLGLDQSAHDGFGRLIALVLAVMLAVLIIRSRRAVAAYVRGPTEASRWRGWLAEAWPYLAVIAITSFWVGSATSTQGGLSGLYFPGVTLAAIIAARLLTIVVLGTLERLLRLDPETQDRLPGLGRRIAGYRRPLELAVTTAIALLCAVVLLQLWGAPAFAWFSGGGIGQRLVSALATVTVAVIVAIAIWEVSHAVLERQLAQTGSGQARSIRLLTLLPILRSTLLVAILTVVGLTALSEIGVNIAPLLAGAGIAGIAIGFGAQHLVQDVITGIFVLFENAIQIGDGVTVAGLSGSVEQLSVRTMRLRASDGAVHIIPFSAVTSITNNNRGLGNAAVSVTVAYDEDTDRVAAVLAEIAAELREDEAFTARVLGELQIFGVDQVRPWGVTITGQIACTDTGRWPVQREFNRRLKKRFAAEGIVLSAAPGAAA